MIGNFTISTALFLRQRPSEPIGHEAGCTHIRSLPSSY